MTTEHAGPLLHVVVDEYTVVQHADGRLEILRHGQPWIYRVEEGAKAIIAVACAVEELRAEIQRHNTECTTQVHPTRNK